MTNRHGLLVRGKDGMQQGAPSPALSAWWRWGCCTRGGRGVVSQWGQEIRLNFFVACCSSAEFLRGTGTSTLDPTQFDAGILKRLEYQR